MIYSTAPMLDQFWTQMDANYLQQPVALKQSCVISPIHPRLSSGQLSRPRILGQLRPGVQSWHLFRRRYPFFWRHAVWIWMEFSWTMAATPIITPPWHNELGCRHPSEIVEKWRQIVVDLSNDQLLFSPVWGFIFLLLSLQVLETNLLKEFLRMSSHWNDSETKTVVAMVAIHGFILELI